MTNAIIAERAPDTVKAVAQAGHEVLSHSYAMDVIPALLSDEEERKNIERCTQLLEQAAGEEIRGWLSPRGTSKTTTPKLLAQAGYRWYGDVSVDNFNAVLFGYAIYFDLAADADQKKFIAFDVDRLMTHLLDNQCRIIDVDGEVTLWGHVGMDPDPARDNYYKQRYAQYLSRAGLQDAPWKPSLRASLMLLTAETGW